LNNDAKNRAYVLELDSRKKIYEIVDQYAGCHMREIQRISGLSFGMVSYHLTFLCKYNLIREEKDGNYVRYYPNTLEKHDEKLLGLLRQRSVRTILMFIIDNEGCSHQQISEGVHLSPSTTTWHLKKLIDNGIIISDRRIKGKAYYLGIPRDRVINLLISYRESFVDTLVDGFLDLWE